jgi:hypothetical protein
MSSRLYRMEYAKRRRAELKEQGVCYTCRKEEARKGRVKCVGCAESHKTYMQSYSPEWRRKHSDYNLQWSRKHKEYCKERCREWRKRNPNYFKEYAKKRRLKMNDKIRRILAEILKLDEKDFKELLTIVKETLDETKYLQK